MLQVKSSRTLELECLITFEVPDPTSILTVLSTTQPASATNVTSHTTSSPSTSPDLSNPQPTTSSTNPDTQSLTTNTDQLQTYKLPPPDTVHALVRPTNTYPMCTCAKSRIVKPRINPTFLLAHLEPKSTKAALNDPSWLSAMQTEYAALIKNATWSLVDLPPSRTTIGCKWVFRVKENPDGSVNKYKVRLAAKGFHQQLGFDYKETFPPVIKPVTVRLVLSLVISNN